VTLVVLVLVLVFSILIIQNFFFLFNRIFKRGIMIEEIRLGCIIIYINVSTGCIIIYINVSTGCIIKLIVIQ